MDCAIQYNVLNEGYIKIIGYMGSDKDVVNSARISYGKQSEIRSLEQDQKLINYLMQHEHTSPFESCTIHFEVKMPIFVARQWLRHRTMSYNEISARYTQLKPEFYIPERLFLQDDKNKQSSSSNTVGCEKMLEFRCRMQALCDESYALYEDMLDEGVSRELSRIILPVNTYTTVMVTTNLLNYMKFIKLRRAQNAQYEIRKYAHVLLDHLAIWCPLTYSAFMKYWN